MAELKNLIVNGAARVNGDIYGNLKGNADTATNADKLDGKDSTAFANASHTHTKSQITDFPTYITGGTQTSSSSADGGSNVYTFTKSDGTTSTLTVKNGTKGSTGSQGVQGPKGDTGATGPQGPQGVSGVTPTIAAAAGSNIGSVGTPSVSASTSGTKTTFTFNYLKGAKGDTGAAGSNGVSCTHSWNGTTLTVTSASGTSSANLKGDKGDTGAKGDTGSQGATGPQGPAGSVTSLTKTGSGNAVTDVSLNTSTKVLTVTKGNAGISDAPSDNQSYVRKNGTWTSLGGALNESVVLHIDSISYLVPLYQTTIIVRNKADNSVIHMIQWNGDDINFIVKDEINYTVEFGEATNFTTPATQEYTAFGDTTRNISAVYNEINAINIAISYSDKTLSAYNDRNMSKSPVGVVVKSANMSIILSPSATATTWDSGVSWGNSQQITYADGTVKTCHLISMAEGDLLRTNQATINTALSGWGTALTYDSQYQWSNEQYSSGNAWYWEYGLSCWYNYYKFTSSCCRAVSAF